MLTYIEVHTNFKECTQLQTRTLQMFRNLQSCHLSCIYSQVEETFTSMKVLSVVWQWK